MSVVIEHLLHSLELSGLSFCEILFVCRPSIEWQLVVWVLRVFLMEDIVLAVVPVREGRMVGTCLLDRLGRFDNFRLLWLSTFALLSLVLCLIGRR